MSRRALIGGVTWLLLLTLVLWLSSLLTLRLPHQNDTLVHLRWADQFLSALREGWLIPRWASASIDGLGDPTFLYYQPLFYYISSTFAFVGLRSEYALLCAAMLPFLLLGCVVCFGVLRRYPYRNALFGATFILLCPVLYFVATNVGAFPWALSLPFSILFIVESTRDKPRVERLAVFMCLICLSHLLSGLMALASVGLARLAFAFPKRETINGHLVWAAGVVLGLGLAGFFLYPAISQLHMVNPDGWVQGANFDWRRAFALPTFTFVEYGFRWFAIQLPFALIALTLCILVLAPRAGNDDTPGNIRAKRMGWVALAALALGSEIAYPLYAMISPLQKLQFPYRFVFLAWLVANLALLIRLNEGAWAHWRRWARAAALGLFAAQIAIMAHLQWGLYQHGEKLPARSAFMQGRFGQPEYIPAVRGPDWKQYLVSGKFAGECKRLNIDCTDTVQRTHDFSTRILTATPVDVRLPRLAFPAWRVTIDGKPVELVGDEATGLILVTLAPGEHRITTIWSTMPAEVTGRWMSGIAFLVLIAILAAPKWRRGRKHALPAGRPARAPVVTEQTSSAL